MWTLFDGTWVVSPIVEAAFLIAYCFRPMSKIDRRWQIFSSAWCGLTLCCLWVDGGSGNVAMSYPTIELRGKKVILLNGFEKSKVVDQPVHVSERTKLEEAAKKNCDAVAFAYYSGKWIAAA